MARGDHFTNRRTRLRALLPGKTFLFFSGPFHFRNTPGVIHPYRPSSHWLYFFGWFPPNCAALITPDATVIYARRLTRDDRFWDGDDDLDSLQILAQVDQLDGIDALPAALGKIDPSQLLTVPVHQKEFRTEISTLIGRPVELSGVDRELVDALVSLRLIHDPVAISELKIAGAAAREAFEVVTPSIRAGRFEREVRADIERELRARDFDLSFIPIVTRRGDVLHNRTFDGKLEDGDLLLLDFGAETRAGFASDITRTIPISGKFSAEQQAIYDLVKSVQVRAIGAIRPGMGFRDLHLSCCRNIASGLIDLGLLRGDPEEIVTKGAHALFFPHGLGHLLGLDVHDMEDFGDIAGYAPGRNRSSQFGLSFLRLDRDLAEGMAVTVEPGIYFIDAILDDDEFTAPFRSFLNPETIARFRKQVRGVRIEDDVLVTAAGCEVLTS